MHRILVVMFLVGCSTAKPSPSAERRGYDLDAVDGLGLFSDERVKAATVLSEALTQKGVRMVPARTLNDAYELALQGRNPITNLSCGMPLKREQARRRWSEELGVDGTVNASVSCLSDGGCTLMVIGTKLKESVEGLTLVAPLDAQQPPLMALEGAAPKLDLPAPLAATGTASTSTSIETEAQGSFGALLSVAEPVVRTSDVLEVKVWSPDKRDTAPVLDVTEQNAFAGLTADNVVECLSLEQSSIQLLLDVGPRGELLRCEGVRQHEACMCDRLKVTSVNAGLANRRWAASLNVRRKDQLSDDGTLVIRGSWNTRIEPYGTTDPKMTPLYRAKVSDPSIEDWTPGPGRLAASCFSNAFKQSGRVSTKWTVSFDENGVAKSAGELLGQPMLSGPVATCVKKTLLTARAPCPGKKSTSATAELVVEAVEAKRENPSL